MAPNPQCSAIANAMRNKGLSYNQLATSVGSTEQDVAAICSGQRAPTSKEFSALAGALGISTQNAPPGHIAK